MALICRDTVRLLGQYLEGILPPNPERELRRHLDRCRDCRLVLDVARETLETYFDREPERVERGKSQAA